MTMVDLVARDDQPNLVTWERPEQGLRQGAANSEEVL